MNASEVCADGSVSNPNVLLIEEDEVLASSVLQAMERAGFSASWARTGTEALSLKASLHPHVVLMDLTLPDMSGLALLTRLAGARDCGIIVICDLNEEADRIVGLELGADDYMAKPPGLRELVARIRAVHRRVGNRTRARVTSEAGSVLHVGPIRINAGRRTVHTADGRQVALTSTEFSILELLANAAGTTVSRDDLSKVALGRPWQPDDRSVDQLVFTLRQKLPRDESGTVLIQSIRGIGYWLRAPDRVPVHAEAERRPEMAA